MRNNETAIADELLHTLEICETLLPGDASVHRERLRRIGSIVKGKSAGGPERTIKRETAVTARLAVLAELHRLLGNRSDDQKSWDWIRKSLDALLDMRFGGEIDEMVLIEDTLHLKIWNLVGVMRRGQVVTIYVDPYSRTVEEGRAELLSLVR